MGQRQTMQQEIDEITAAFDGELYITDKTRGQPELQLAEFVVEESNLLDLLITLLYSSAFGGRVLLSFPGRDVKVGDRSLYHNDSPDVAQLQAILHKIPNVSEMSAHAVQGELSLKGFLEGIDLLLYPLLVWLTELHRGGTRILPDCEKPEGITCECIVSVAVTPERETKFQQHKASSGKSTLMAFHGSCNGNWHSIIREGIRVMSGTEYQTTGTSYGRGVYFGSHSSISMSYCKNRGTHWPHSQFYNAGGSITSSLVIMALVEIIDHPTDVKVHPCSTGNPSNGGSSNIYVSENEELFVTRFLFVNPASDICCCSLLEPCLRIVEKKYLVMNSSPTKTLASTAINSNDDA